MQRSNLMDGKKVAVIWREWPDGSQMCRIAQFTINHRQNFFPALSWRHQA